MFLSIKIQTHIIYFEKLLEWDSLQTEQLKVSGMLKGALQKDRSMTSTQRSSKTVGLSRRENILNAWPNVFLKISLNLDDQKYKYYVYSLEM